MTQRARGFERERGAAAQAAPVGLCTFCSLADDMTVWFFIRTFIRTFIRILNSGVLLGSCPLGARARARATPGAGLRGKGECRGSRPLTPAVMAFGDGAEHLVPVASNSGRGAVRAAAYAANPPDAEYTYVVVCCPDREGIMEDIYAPFARFGLNVLDARCAERRAAAALGGVLLHHTERG